MDPNEITPPELRTDRTKNRDAAVDVVRQKLAALYAEEPDAKEEVSELEQKPVSEQLSKHQLYMEHLQASGRDMAEIQVAWHQYYAALPDIEKHEVWQEFYSEHAKRKASPRTEQVQALPATQLSTHHVVGEPEHIVDNRDSSTIKGQLITRLNTQALKDNHHARSLAFGVSMGLVVVFILMFSFFNERFIAPFIRPSQNVSATPIIVDPNASGPVGQDPKIIIPKINVEAPVVYDVPTIEEKDVQAGLERGVVHYVTTPNPGEKGNAVIFGHSSGNIINKGKYKFAFILLKSLEKDDTLILQKDGKRYVYKVYNKYVTNPKDLSVLGSTDKTSSITLITCDPPGTSTNRLVVQAEQIFPDPSANAASSVKTETSRQPDQLAGNSESLWHKITNWLF